MKEQIFTDISKIFIDIIGFTEGVNNELRNVATNKLNQQLVNCQVVFRDELTATELITNKQLEKISKENIELQKKIKTLEQKISKLTI